MKKIRILQVTGGLGVGGIEKLVVSFFENIDKEKYAMDFLVYGDEIGEFEGKVKELGGNIFRIPVPSKNYRSFYKNVRSIIKDNGPYDIVHSHVFFNTGFIMKAAKKEGVPIRIAHSHDNLSYIKESIIRKLYIKLMRHFLLKYSTKKCACSSLAGQYLFGKDEFDKNGIVIYNGINIDKFVFNKNARNTVRKKLGLSNEILIGNIGRLETQKNQSYLLKIIKELPKQYKLIIVGDGSLKKALEDEINDNNLTERVIMTGNRSDIQELLCAMDIFVLPSIHEGLGIVLIEAQANGLPCIAPTNIVPPEAKILDNFIFLDFPEDENLTIWCDTIKKIGCSKRKENVVSVIKQSGYDINDIGKVLDKLYDTKE